MQHKGEDDWYHEILTGAMKYLSEDSTQSEESTQSEKKHLFYRALHFHGFRNRAVIVGSEASQKPSFVSVISSKSIREFRNAFIRSISENMNIDIERVEYHGIVTFELKQRANPSKQKEISEEEIEEKITEQLAMVIEDSLHELNELRANFNYRRKRANEEFRKRLLEISNGVDGGAHE